MAIVKMSKIKLVGLSYDKERLLNALHKSGAVEVISTEEIEDTFTINETSRKDEIKEKLDRTNKCIDFFIDHLAKAKKEAYYPKEVEGLENTLVVSYDEFISAGGNEMELSYIIDKLEDYAGRLLTNRSNKVKLLNLKAQLTPYIPLKKRFSEYVSTEKTTCILGLISETNLLSLSEFLKDYPLCDMTIESKGSVSIISLIVFNEELEAINAKLSELAFSKCSFDYTVTAETKIEEIDTQLKNADLYEGTINKKVVGKSSHLRNLKILADFYNFELEKINVSEKFRCTKKTFTLEGYIPTEDITDITNSLYDISTAIFLEFSEPKEGEIPPTLLKNKNLAKQAEFVTNMYSTPNYNEVDPNRVVFWFFMIFFGLIMSDIGYGISLMLIGFVMTRKIKIENGTKKLIRIIGYGGFFTMIFGFLFGSLFGVNLYTFLPDPTMGVRSDILIILLGCLGLGVIQISAGYIMKAENQIKRGQIADAILDSLLWVVFFVGLVFASFNFLMTYFEIPVASWLTNIFNVLQLPGLVLIGASLIVIVLTAGRKEKGFGKITKGLGSLYGIINLFSDILSYARLFGLMLSGMIIAQQFNSMGLSLINAGSVGIVFGPVVIIIGHVFNLAMGVLGAYIHVSRLQYIEFFSKFYEGEGELFTPLGSTFNYIYLTK